MPGVQKPHCEPCRSTIACCTGCSVVAIGEILDRDQFRAVDLAEQQDAGVDRRRNGAGRRAGAASTTVQAPQSPSRAALLRALGARLLAQPVEQGRARREAVEVDVAPAEPEMQSTACLCLFFGHNVSLRI